MYKVKILYNKALQSDLFGLPCVKYSLHFGLGSKCVSYWSLSTLFTLQQLRVTMIQIMLLLISIFIICHSVCFMYLFKYMYVWINIHIALGVVGWCDGPG